jgi:hypothetical protein
MKNLVVTLLVMFCVFESASGMQLVAPGYTAESYASYTQTGIGPVSYMAFDDAGNLYATHRNAGAIWRVTPAGTAAQFASGFGTLGIGWGGGTSYGDYLYVADGGVPNGQIRKINKSGVVSGFASFSPPLHGLGFAEIDRTGNYGGKLYTATASQDHTYSLSTSGVITLFSDFPGWRDGGGPTDLAFDLIQAVSMGDICL